MGILTVPSQFLWLILFLRRYHTGTTEIPCSLIRNTVSVRNRLQFRLESMILFGIQLDSD
jgi:hypothetical protein